MGSRFHLAQVNVGRMLAGREDPAMAGFFTRLDEINQLAESSIGFVWRLKDDSGNATYLRPFDDDSILINLSVWESVEALAAFTYRSAHKELIAGRKKWFEDFGQPFLALWWIPAGSIPGLDEAKERLDYLQAHGPTPFAFAFKTAFPAPSDDDARPERLRAKAGSGH
jgi:hypothetical protein